MTDAAVNRWLPRPARVLAGQALEFALNRALALDPESSAALERLQGCRVHLHLRGPELALVIHVADGRLKVEAPDPDADTSVRVTTSPGSLLAMALRGDDAAAPGKVELAGDAELARRLERLARGYAPDIEEAFARTFGDVLGVPLARALHDVLAHLRESSRHFTEDAADWVREEARVAVSGAEMDAFLDQVDALRERAERLQARLVRLAARRHAPT